MNTFKKIVLSLFSILQFYTFIDACGGTFTVTPACGTNGGTIVFDGPSDTLMLNINGTNVQTLSGTHIEFNNVAAGSSYSVSSSSTSCATSGTMALALGLPFNINSSETSATCGSCDERKEICV